MINDVTGMDMRDLHLVHASKVIDDNLTVADYYKIGNYAYIQSFVQLRGVSDVEEVREPSDPDISGTAMLKSER